MDLFMSLKFCPFLPALLFENNFCHPQLLTIFLFDFICVRESLRLFGAFGFAHAQSQPSKTKRANFSPSHVPTHHS
jgi:hypothetical protein